MTLCLTQATLDLGKVFLSLNQGITLTFAFTLGLGQGGQQGLFLLGQLFRLTGEVFQFLTQGGSTLCEVLAVVIGTGHPIVPDLDLIVDGGQAALAAKDFAFDPVNQLVLVIGGFTGGCQLLAEIVEYLYRLIQ